MSSQSYNFADLFNNTQNLLKGSENIKLADCLNGKEAVALYFSAHWCPPCKQFTPKLAGIYNQIIALGKSFEIVFISSDQSEQQFQDYFKEMPWAALPYSERDLKKQLAEKYKCSGIPYLVILDGKTGETLTLEGRSAVMSGGPEAFPFTSEAIENAKQAKVLKKTQLFNEWKIFSDSFDVSQLLTKEAVAIFVGSATGISGIHVFGAIKKTYESLNGKLAVVYIPSDVQDQDEQKTFLEKMPSSWFKIQENSQALKQLQSAFDISDPLTIIINGQGSQIYNEEASRIIYDQNQAGFPWSKEALEAEQKKALEAKDKFKSSVKEGGLKFLEEAKIINPQKEVLKQPLDELKKKDLVGLYFSAHWCPPCRNFTPVLIEEYKKLKQEEKNLEVIFISRDSDQKSFDDYYAEMPWLALDYSQADLRNTFSEGFGVDGIPCLIWVNPTTGELNSEGRKTISDYGAQYYPWTPELIQKAQDELEQRKAKAKFEKLQKIKDVEQGWKNAKTVIVKNHIYPAGEVSADYTLKFGMFNTFVADIKLSKGQFYYEATVIQMGQFPQMGWITDGFYAPTQVHSGSGVGDDDRSFGVDGHRQQKWLNGEQSFGSKWKMEDVIGFAFDTNTKTFTVSVNGSYEAPNGVVFNEKDIKCDIPWVSPGLTSQSGTFNVNFGERPFKFAPPSNTYKSVHEINLENLALYE